MCLLLAELNGIPSWKIDIGNAYLEAKITEKVFIKSGPDFGEREGCLLIIYEALYGLKSSGLVFNLVLDKVL